MKYKKPHIRLYSRNFGIRVWICCLFKGSTYGYTGNSPESAYQSMLKYRKLRWYV